MFDRGYYPKGGGDIRIRINPIELLTYIDLTDFGEIKRFFGRSFVAGNLPQQVSYYSLNSCLFFIDINLDC